MQQAAAAAVPAVGAGVAHTCVDEQPRSAKYTVREVDAASFMGPAGQLRGAPMKVTSSYILDHTIRRTEAHIEVLPPRDLPFVPSKTQKMRRVNDHKTLTALGIAALARARGSKGLLGASTVVWKIEMRCRGTFLCDKPLHPADGCYCNLRVVYSATIRQVNDGTVQISVTGLPPSDRRSSWHSAARVWDPAALVAKRERKRSAQVAIIEQRSAELTNLRVAAVKQQRTGESGAATASAGAAGAASAGTGGVSAATPSSSSARPSSYRL